MKTIITTFLILTAVFFSRDVFAQPSALWVKIYNNFLANKNDEIVKSVTDNNGNIYVTGTSLSNAVGWDILTIKYDAAGNFKWSRLYNNTATDDYDSPEDMCIDQQGNVYITGSTIGLNSTIDGIVLKYDSTGALKWTRLFNRTNIPQRKGFGQSIVYRNGLFVACRFTYNDNSECGIMKLTTNGDSLTYRVLGSQTGNGSAFTRGIEVDDVGNVYACSNGSYNPGEKIDIAFHKLSSNTMSYVWTKYYSGPSHEDDYVYDIKLGPDGNVFLTGSSFQNNQDHDFMLFKIGRDDGAVIWSKRINNPAANQSDYGSVIAFDNNANIIVGGKLEGLTTAADLLTVKFSPSGTILWQQTYNYNTTREDRFSDLKCDGFGNIYVTGNSYREGTNIMDLVTLKYSSAGVLDWANIYQGTSAFDRTSTINLDQSGNVIISGQTKGVNTEDDILLVKYASTIGIQPISGEVPSAFALSQNYPNPFNPVTNIKFSVPKPGSVKLAVFDVSGRQVAELVNENLNAGTYNYDFNASGFSSGIYFYSISAEGFRDTKKMILIK